jgi:hypothetical protein
LGGGGGGALEAERWEAFDASEPIAHHFALLEVLRLDLKSPSNALKRACKASAGGQDGSSDTSI